MDYRKLKSGSDVRGVAVGEGATLTPDVAKTLGMAFARYVAKRTPRTHGWRLIVGHSDALADGERLLVALRERLPVVEAHLVEVGPAVGAHAGPGTLVVGLQPAPL